MALAATVAGCPADLAQRLASTGGAGQLVTTESAGTSAVQAQVALWSRRGGCWHLQAGPWPALIGVHGFSAHHREGDGSTPEGIYAIGPVVYGTAPNPGARTTYHRLVCGDWWDEDPRSPDYNTFQHVACGREPPFGGDSEALWTEVVAYTSFLVVEFNMHPVVPYAGSAIFVHASFGSPTEGCVSLPQPDLDLLLRLLNWSLRPHIVMAPAAVISHY